MEVKQTEIPGVLEVFPKVFGDERGFFLETFQAERYEDAGISGPFLQDNTSRSAAGVLRGLHLQHPSAQGKLVWVLEGTVFDVAVDVRVGSPTFGRHVARTLRSDTKNQLWVPPGFAHGFLVLEGPALFVYKCTTVYAPQHELSVLWNDPALGIEWPLDGFADGPKLSAKDEAGERLDTISPDRLPGYDAQ